MPVGAISLHRALSLPVTRITGTVGVFVGRGPASRAHSTARCSCGGDHAADAHNASSAPNLSAADSANSTASPKGSLAPSLSSFLTGTPSPASASLLPALSRRPYSSQSQGGEHFKREVTIEDLLAENRKWAKETQENLPGFFEALSKQQQPDFLWLGCSDSRVPANQIVGLLPGEVFGAWSPLGQPPKVVR